MPRKRSGSRKPHRRNVKAAEKTTSGGPSLISALLELLLSIKPVQSEAMKYIRKAEIEFLKALKALLESQIQIMEKRIAKTKKERIKKIDITED